MKKSSLPPGLKKKIDDKRHWRSIRHSKAHHEERLIRRKKRRERMIKHSWAVEIKAPPQINLYRGSDHTRTVRFLQELRQAISRNRKVRICFRDTKSISAAAGLLFIAELDRLVSHFPSTKIDCTRPPRRHDSKYGNESFLIESILNQIGFFKLIGKPERNVPSYPNVSCWRYSQGVVAEGSIAGSLINQVDDKLAPEAKRRLYRGAIGAICNCVDHAYPTVRPDGLNVSDSRWWMFVGINMNRLIIVVCDLGVGIPTTVPQKHSQARLKAVLEFLNISGNNDSDLIHASTYLSKSRTQQKHRGKGGKDILGLLDHYQEANLTIYSNKGCFRGSNKISRSGKVVPWAVKDEQKLSIRGTVIEWTVPIQELEA